MVMMMIMMVNKKFRGGPNTRRRSFGISIYKKLYNIYVYCLKGRLGNHKNTIFGQCKHTGPPVFEESTTTLCGETVAD